MKTTSAIVPAVVVFIAALLAAVPLFTYGYPVAYSAPYNILWAHQYAEQFFGGQLLPRWLEQSFAGLGNPTFHFYPPVSMQATLPFAFLPESQRLSASMFLAILTLAIGTMVYVRDSFRELTGSLWLPAGVGALAAFSPYFLENIYVRGAIGEVWAMAWLPWLFWALTRNLRGGGRGVWVSLFYALVALSHLPTLLVLTVLFAVLSPMTVFPLARFRRFLRQAYLPLLAGLGLVAFFLVPAYWDQGLVSMSRFMFSGEYNPMNRLLIDGVSRIQPQLTGHDYDRTLLPLTLLLMLFFLLGAVVYFRRQLPGPTRYQMLAWLLGILTVLFMVSDLALPVYRTFPLLQKIQFSLRWLSLSVIWPLMVIAVGGVLLSRRRPTLGALFFVGVGSLWLGVASWTFNHVPWNPAEMREMQAAIEEHPPFPQNVDMQAGPFEPMHPRSALGFLFIRSSRKEVFFADAVEYLPRWADNTNGVVVRNEHAVEVPPSQPDHPLIEWAQGEGEVWGIRWEVGKRSFTVATEDPGLLYLRMFYWPGWKLRLEGQSVPPGRSEDARLAVSVPPGLHEVEIEYTGTRAQAWGEVISFVSLLSVLGFSLAPRIRSGLRSVPTRSRDLEA
jgi:hypothetical protein